MSPLGHLRTGLARFGTVGIVGIACLLAAALLALLAARPLEQRRAVLQAELAARHAALKLSGPAARAADDSSTAARLERFYAGFPDVRTAPEWLVQLHAAAQRNGIELLQGEYRLEQRSANRLRRYAIVLPLRGTYQQVRGFVDAVLADIPSAALDDIELRRESVATPQLEARVRMTLYLRASP